MKGSRGGVQISSNDVFFDTDELIVTIKPDYISFKKPDIDYNGKTYKPCHVASDWFRISVASDLKVKKRMQIDDDSTEDELIVYLD